MRGSRQVRTEAIKSTSTVAFLGSCSTPTDVRVWAPASPSTANSTSDAPSATSLCCVKVGADCTYTVMRRMDCTASSEPTARCSSANAHRADLGRLLRIAQRGPGPGRARDDHRVAHAWDLPAQVDVVAVTHQRDVVATNLDLAIKAVAQCLGLFLKSRIA